MATSKIKEFFNYPLDYECEYVLPSKYYLNANTGHSVIKKSQVIIDEPVGIDKNGIFELSKENTKKTDEIQENIDNITDIKDDTETNSL